jgi:transcriptional regulator with XRE-family HTH domain
MTKPTSQLSVQSASTTSTGDSDNSRECKRRSPLAELVSGQLRSKGLRQIDFCRQTGFDQGLLSKILSSVVNTLNVETALKLSEGLGLPPVVVFEVIGKKDVDELLRKFYCNHDPAGRVM